MSDNFKYTQLEDDDGNKLAPITIASAVFTSDGDSIEDTMVRQNLQGTRIGTPSPVNADTLGGHVTADNVVSQELDGTEEIGQTHLVSADLLGGRVTAEDVESVSRSLNDLVVSEKHVYTVTASYKNDVFFMNNVTFTKEGYKPLHAFLVNEGYGLYCTNQCKYSINNESITIDAFLRNIDNNSTLTVTVYAVILWIRV